MKVALVYSFKNSDWFSCTLISKNLRLAYEKSFGADNIISINYDRENGVSLRDLNILVDADVDKIIFIDHQPTPMRFLESLAQVELKLSADREYIVHVFGDYPLFLKEWKEVHNILKGKNLKYICASEKQKKLIEKFVIQKDLVFVSPFPVCSERFYPKEVNRKEILEKYGLKQNDKVILYTGRISLQKSIKESIDLFLRGLESGDISKNTKFVIAGGFDGLGSMYLNYLQLPGEYYRSIRNTINKFPEFEENIVFCGNINNSSLAELYNVADVYLSLSAYHDEDFGMSVAEALMCGTPTLLTNWAGYASFNISDQFVKYVDVELSAFGPKVDFGSAYKKLVSLLEQNKDRNILSEKARAYLSIESCAERLLKISEKKADSFTGVTDLMIRLTHEQIIRGWEFFRLETNREFNSFYFKVYDVYSE